jgi:diacylglycerol kinase family enzyme
MNGVAIPVIRNVKSGASDSTSSQRIVDALRAAGIECDVREAASGDEVAQFARAAIAGRPPMIVAAGGDGTISAIAAQLVGTEIPLGVLPLGTLNHFARDLAVPADLDGAARILGDGNIIRVDVGEVNGRVFLNNSSIGLYPRLVEHRRKLQHRLGSGKWSALFRATMTVLRRYSLLNVRVSANGTTLDRRTPLVFIGNNAYEMDGLKIGLRGRLDAGRLSLHIPRRPGRWGMFAIALRSLFGLRADDDFDSMTASEILIETRKRHARYASDGEVFTTTPPLRYRIRPLALRVVAPARDPGGDIVKAGRSD